MKLPIGIQDFESLRNDRYEYIDKTPLIWKMVNEGKYYFLSRPRRFGKSLLMSTIQAFFEGKRQYFDGTIGNPLFIATDESVDWAWEAYPIMHFDFNVGKYTTKEALEDNINNFICTQEESYGSCPSEVSFGQRFEGVLERAYKQTGKQVVILIDEYDKPLLQAIGNKELQDKFRATLKSFYGTLKSKDEYLKFVLLTGVTKFGKDSVFSDTNNLEDISMDKRFFDVCGITENELTTQLKPYIEKLADYNAITYEQVVDKLYCLYYGYHFCEHAKGLYSTYSVLNTLKKGVFENYWFQTGTPTYLAAQLVLHDYNLEDMEQAKVDSNVLNSIDLESADPIPVIYQSGYLTIKGYDEELNLYQLGFPNKEVEEGFIKFLIPYYLPDNKARRTFDISNYIEDIRNGNTEQFILRIKSLLANTPYDIVKDLEKHYQNQVWLLHKLFGMYVQAEYHPSFGRIDMVLQTPKFCYVIEFKFDGSAQDALDEISRKDYALPFALTGQQIFRVGMNISRETRNVEEYKIG